MKDGSVVVRKDYKVLLVDITKLPAKFGVPSATRGDVAINVAETIMWCWTRRLIRLPGTGSAQPLRW